MTSSHVSTAKPPAYLNLGANKNYKFNTIKSRWEKERKKWLDAKNHPPGDP
jgi:endo-alpha-1,4-polygalactosaminidase (GH114 family)